MMGVIGNLIGYSKLLVLYNFCFVVVGVDVCYVLLFVKDIKIFFASSFFGSKDFVGFSVTISYKEDVLECCVEVDFVVK